MNSEDLFDIEGVSGHRAHVDHWIAHQARNEQNRILHHQAHIEKQENDIGFMAGTFEIEDGSYKSVDDMYRCQAQDEINMANQKIRDLQREIEKQEAIIRSSEREVQKYSRLIYAETNNRGRPARSEYREKIARKFTVQWVESLKSALEVKSCGKLEALISLPTEESLTSQRNWRRWLNGDAIPTYTTLNALLNAKIMSGKFAGEPLYKIPVTPDHNSLLTLLRFI